MNDGEAAADSEPRLGTFLIETPEQLRALAEPLRQSLLEQFCRPATIKAAAGPAMPLWKSPDRSPD